MNLSLLTGTRLVFGVLLALSAPAMAHTGTGMAYSFTGGFIHPWLGIDHLLVIFSVGLWRCRLADRSAGFLPLVFVMAMAAGAGIHFAGFTLVGAEQGIAWSALTFGLILWCNRRIPFGLASGLAAIFAVCHGYVHAAEIAPETDQLAYTLGFLSATVMLLWLGRAAGAYGSNRIKVLRTHFGLLNCATGLALLAGF